MGFFLLEVFDLLLDGDFLDATFLGFFLVVVLGLVFGLDDAVVSEADAVGSPKSAGSNAGFVTNAMIAIE